MGAAVWAGLCAAPALAAAATPADLFYERTVMTAADQRCGLFEPPVRAALQAGQAQARGAALRAGADAASLRSVEARALAKARAADCRSTDIAMAAGRVRNAFEGYARLIRMSYPGDAATWIAVRLGPAETYSWRLSQSARFGFDSLTFGVVGRGDQRALMAVAAFTDGKTPYAARLVMRDPVRSQAAYLPRGGGLSGRLAPRSVTRAVSAETRSPAGRDLMGRKAKTAGWAFRFPTSAMDALSVLDPREAVAVEFLFAGRERDEVRTAYVEVGDFAAGRAFVMATR